MADYNEKNQYKEITIEKLPESFIEGNNKRALAASFLRTLLYFDVFSYPLKESEILEYSSEKSFEKADAFEALSWLEENSLVNYYMGFYYLGNDSSKVGRRLAGNKLAEKRMKSARIFSGIIASFPFTRGVYISGSLSKGYMNKQSDIDYFILTSPRRLWLCRTILIAFKKIFLLNSHKNFCINYLVDTNNLEIRERNMYTATEVAMLLPMHNHHLFNKFLKVNDWYREYYPHYSQKSDFSLQGIPVLKRMLERLLNNRLGDLLDDLFFSITVKFWNKKYKVLNKSNPDLELKWEKHISQYHPRHFQLEVMKQFNRKIEEYEILAGFPIAV